MDVDDLLRELNDIPVKSKAGASLGTSSSRPAASSAASRVETSVKASTSQSVPSSSNRVAAAPAPSATSSTRPASGRAVASGNPSSFSSMMDDLDLHMITPQPARMQHASSDQSLNGGQTPPGRKSGLTRMKCAALFLGGTRFSRGLNGAAGGSSPVCCDALRCTKCDFKVVAARDRQWSDSVDYLFLRNNYPDDHKLAAKQKRDPSSCAYCCQCSWVSASDEVTRVDYGGELRWVCGGHDMA